MLMVMITLTIIFIFFILCYVPHFIIEYNLV